MHAVPRKPEESTGSPGTRVTDSCELLCGCLEMKPVPLEEPSKLVSVGPSPQLLGGPLVELNYNQILCEYGLEMGSVRLSMVAHAFCPRDAEAEDL